MTGPISHEFICAQCGGVAMRLTATAPGQPLDSTQDQLSDEVIDIFDAAGVRTEGGGGTQWAASEVAGGAAAVAAAILAGDTEALFRLNPEIVPHYCRACAVSYCQSHWVLWPLFDPDWPTWFEELRGRCPAGHERRIYD